MSGSGAAGAADWDAATYDRISDPALGWGQEVLLRLELAGHELVLDASPAMLAEARRRLSGAEGEVEFLQADLLQPIPLDEPVDAVLSTATFHWIPDHDTLIANLAEVMRPGAQLAAQSGQPRLGRSSAP
jgi:trans-aconitate 2-methyltransferase